MEQSIEWADLREVDFRVVREDYCRYQLDDGTCNSSRPYEAWTVF